MTLNRFHTLFSCFNIDFEQVNTGRGWILYKKTIAIFENFDFLEILMEGTCS